MVYTHLVFRSRSRSHDDQWDTGRRGRGADQPGARSVISEGVEEEGRREAASVETQAGQAGHAGKSRCAHASQTETETGSSRAALIQQ